MLQHEESKLLKKIQNTRKRAEEIMAIKQRNEKRFEERMKLKEKEEADLMQRREQQQFIREQRKLGLKKRQEELRAQKNSGFVETRSRRINDEKERKNFKSSMVEENRKKRDIVVAEERRIARSLQRFQRKRKNQNKMNYSMRVNKQSNDIKSVDRNIHKMEQIEKEMLDRLKNSQALEQEAYQSLEQAIQQSENSYQNRLTEFSKNNEGNPARVGRIKKTVPKESNTDLSSEKRVGSVSTASKTKKRS